MDLVTDGLRSRDENPVTDEEVDRVALDVARWGYRETARHLIAFQRAIRRASKTYDALNEKVSYSVSANETVNGWTGPNGDLVSKDDEGNEVVYDCGSDEVLLNGYFDADTLLAIAMHLRSQQI